MNFEELAGNLGLELDEYRELIELFIDTGANDFKNIKAGMANSDLDQVMRSAHTIKGAAGNLGLLDVSETAGIIEESVNNNIVDDLAAKVDVLKTQFDAIEAFVHR